jgi:hypothetical protein
MFGPSDFGARIHKEFLRAEWRNRREEFEETSLGAQLKNGEHAVSFEMQSMNAEQETLFVCSTTGERYEFDRFISLFHNDATGKSPFTDTIMEAAKEKGRARSSSIQNIRDTIRSIRGVATDSEMKGETHNLDPKRIRIPGAEKLEPSPVRCGVLLRLIKGYPNELRPVVEWLKSGFENGFGIQAWAVPRLLGYGVARLRSQDVEEEVKKIRLNVEQEIIDHNRVMKIATDPDRIPLEHFTESPTFPRDKTELGEKTGKIRMITNSKSPSTSTGCSVNDLLSPGWSTVELPNIRDVKRMFSKAGRGCIFLKEDIKAAYRLLAVRLHDLVFLVFRCGKEHFLDTRLSFGLRTAPRIFSVFADTLLYILFTEGVESALHYLDDFVVVIPLVEGWEKAGAIRDLIRTIFAVLGIELSDGKEVFGQRGDVLGFLFDTVEQTIKMPPKKAAIIDALIQKATTPGAMSLHEFDQLCGKLVDLCEITPHGRPMLQQAWKMKRLMHDKPPFTPIHVWPILANDLRWFGALLPTAVAGKSYVPKPWVGDVLKGTNPRSDSSLTGMGGHCNGVAWQHEFNEAEKEIISRSGDIHIGETAAVLTTTWVFRGEWHGKRVNFECDNAGVVDAINVGECRHDTTHMLIRTLADIALQGDFNFGISHIDRELNTLADCLSKFFPLIQEAFRSSEVKASLDLQAQLRHCTLLPDPYDSPECPSLIKVLSQALLPPPLD